MSLTVKAIRRMLGLSATGTQLNRVADSDSTDYTETLSAAGAVSTTTRVSKLALSGTGAVTLAAPTVVGIIKVIQMTTDNGDVTMALTNVVGQSSGTTATFNDVGDSLTLIAGANSKWIVLKEQGISLA